jgi:hypothetical protein
MGTTRTRTDLAGGVYDVTIEFDAFVVDTFGEGAFDGWIVRVHEMVFDELDDQGRFT